MATAPVQFSSHSFAGIVDHLRREVAAQPAKAVVLGALIAVAAVIWGPRLFRTGIQWTANSAGLVKGGESTFASPGADKAAAALGLTNARTETTGTKDHELGEGSFAWLDQLERLLAQAPPQSWEAISQLDNPFCPTEPSASQLVPSQSAKQLESNRGATAVDDLPSADLRSTSGLAAPWKVRSLVIGQDFQAAIVDNRLVVLEPGQPLPRISLRTGEQEIEFTVSAIEPTGILLRYGDQTIRLPLGSTQSRVRVFRASSARKIGAQDGTL